MFAQVAALAPDTGVPIGWAIGVCGALVSAIGVLWASRERAQARDLAARDASILRLEGAVARADARSDEARARELESLRSSLAATHDLADHTIAVTRMTDAIERLDDASARDRSHPTRKRT